MVHFTSGQPRIRLGEKSAIFVDIFGKKLKAFMSISTPAFQLRNMHGYLLKANGL
jgi:hypothetical protein